MSAPSITTDGDEAPRVSRLGAAVQRPARAAAFWTAVALPVLQLALLADGLATPSETITFLVLMVLNMFALLVGHSYRQE